MKWAFLADHPLLSDDASHHHPRLFDKSVALIFSIITHPCSVAIFLGTGLVLLSSPSLFTLRCFLSIDCMMVGGWRSREMEKHERKEKYLRLQPGIAGSNRRVS